MFVDVKVTALQSTTKGKAVYVDHGNSGDENGFESYRTDQLDFIMHHKFFILDEMAVLTGSLNFTAQVL